MLKTPNILISVEERHVQNLLNGSKTIELRRRAIRIPKGSRVWIYSKVPVGQVCALGIVDRVVEASPADIWAKYGEVSGITAEEFDKYFSDTDTGCAIVFSRVQKMPNTLSLSLMRSKLQSFHPPQFFKYLSNDSAELAFFQQQISIS